MTSEQYCADDYTTIIENNSSYISISETGWGNGTFVNTNTTMSPSGVFTTLVITPGMTFINSLNFDTPEGLFSLSSDAQQIIFNYLGVHNFDDPTKARVKYFLDHFNFFWINEQPAGTDIDIFNSLAQNGFSSESNMIINKWIKLKDKLVTNPNLLLNIPCAEIPKWKILTQFSPPQSVKNKIESLNNQSIFTDYNIQYLDHAAGAAINLDYFPVTINQMPTNPQTGNQFTPSQFLNYVRLNINNFVNTNISSFSPSTITGINESAIWNS